jgi:hypothetical protein
LFEEIQSLDEGQGEIEESFEIKMFSVELSSKRETVSSVILRSLTNLEKKRC